uniref:Protochlorophyllide reductase n=1 Tax=Chrysotila carterae TaxID=13221 RepID=A0A7S4C3A4_CHRCT
MNCRRVAVVTGSNCGVGFAVASALAAPPHAYHVILACRSVARANDAAMKICKACPSASVSTVLLDTSDLDLVRTCCETLRGQVQAISVLINNAGIGGIGRPAEPTADGDDLVFRTNFVGHFMLTLGLLDLLFAGAPSRVVNVSSVTHRSGSAEWEASLPFHADARTYSSSKLALACFTTELNRRYGATHGLRAISANPGAVCSEIWFRGQQPPWQARLLRALFRCVFLSPAQGATPIVSAATATEWDAQAPKVKQKTATATAAAGAELPLRPNDAMESLYLCPYRTPTHCPMPWELHGPFAGARACSPHPLVRDAGACARLWEMTCIHLVQRTGRSPLALT